MPDASTRPTRRSSPTTRSGDGSLPVAVGLYLLPFAGIAFLWFIVALRMWAAASTQRLNNLQSNLQLISGIVFVALFFVGAAATSVLASSVQFADGPIDPGGRTPVPDLRQDRDPVLRDADGGDVRVHDLGPRPVGARSCRAGSPGRLRRRPVPAVQRDALAAARPRLPGVGRGAQPHPAAAPGRSPRTSACRPARAG